ncbi:protein spinster homolog 3 isoform X5 [Prionailurus viverrinus]|uniref:protein spinster homolog 3 isoform X5 n=1 Tax=Prionailurus viverrinus TaxID=61388 RepID=UPI001FF3A389|nr:protein spinster homolog 3 isoform X5 [Prionailurus viverrinus]
MSAECGEPGPEGPQGPSPGPGGLPGASGLGQCPPRTTSAPWSLPLWRAHAAAAVLCYVNLLNYMHWFIIPGVLLDVQKFFEISDSRAGLLQTVFIGCLLLSAPVFGYLGDRHSRKATLSIGILLWSGAGLSSSFISPQYSWLFFLSRGVVGTGSASYSTIAPTILGDLFVRDQRTRVLAIFYIFIPVGSWSFVWSTLGVTAIAFVTGALGFWAPKFLFEARVVHGLQRPCLQEPCSSQDRKHPLGTCLEFGLRNPSPGSSLIFGALTVVTGIIGVVLGAEASRRYKKVNPRAEPLLCAGSLLVAAPCLYLALILAPTTFLASYVSAPGPRGAASVLQLGGGCRHPAESSVAVPEPHALRPASLPPSGSHHESTWNTVRGGAQVPGDSRGFADHSGPHPGGRQQPLPYWTGVQHPEGRAPRLLPAGLPQPPAEFPVLCICHCPGRGLLPADSAAPGVGPGPGPGAWHRDPGQRGHGEASPAFWRGHRHRGPLRPPPSCPPPCTPPAGRRSIRALSPSGCGSGPPAELHLSFLPSQPESWQGLWRELSCQRLRREAWACARPAPGPQTGWLPVGPD